MKKLFTLVFVLSTLQAFAQSDSITQLDEVLLSDIRLHEHSGGYKIQTITDSSVTKNSSSLTNLLRFNSTIFFKENGPGMVSSAAFRGTNAAHTAVVWNGININSQLNGQTDFNTIYTNNYDNIQVRSGGGSVLYGSGAIGGSIHLNNQLRFSKHFENQIQFSYGSFNSRNGHLQTSYGNEIFTLSAGVDYVASDNDFEYLGTNRRNENGEFGNLNLNFNAGVFLNSKNLLKFYHNTFFGSRHFSGGLFISSQDSYKDENTRSLLEWQYTKAKIRSTLRFAQIYEHYRYFGSQNSTDFSFGKTNRLQAQYDFKYSFSNNINVNAVAEYSSTQGDGSDIADVERNVFAGILLLKHQINEKFGYGFQLRQEVANDYESPLLFAADAAYAFSEVYSLKMNVSKNFRMPTFNDIYWQPGGNPNLVPETSWQAELGQQLKYNSLNFGLNGYFIKAEDMIKWIPQGNLWYPQNINEVNSYGAELGVDYQEEWNSQSLDINVDYAYTISENAETNKQLMYVPLHKTTASAAYAIGNLSAFYQFLWNGDVFTTTDESMELEGYNISNFGIAYDFFSRKNYGAELLFRINNIYNKNYQITAGRPMPPRNFNVQLNINI